MKFKVIKESKDVKIEVENPGLLEVPKGKKVYDLPVSHFKKLIDKKGREKVVRALTNLQTWNKNDDPKIASWAKKMKKSLEGYGEKKTKNESLYVDPLTNKTTDFDWEQFDDISAPLYSVARAGMDGSIVSATKDYDGVKKTVYFMVTSPINPNSREYLTVYYGPFDSIEQAKRFLYRDFLHNEYEENESLKESSLNEEHTMVREEEEELDNAIKEAIHQTQIVSKTHEDRETKMIMRKVRELLNQARNLY